ncbi:MAG: (2Fe-2S)-binding protein [Actinomycetia bacterium]|nr:(2Fe-2S)-binding protein [Actinomycetes bacterium]
MLSDVPVVAISDGAGVHVLADRCSHLSGPLSEGDYHDGCLTCPWHGNTFRVSDGTVARGPATAPHGTVPDPVAATYSRKSFVSDGGSRVAG